MFNQRQKAMYSGKGIKWSRYRPGVAQRVGTGIALLFRDHGTRRGWVVSSTALLHFTPGKDPVPILQKGEWAPGPVWTGGKPRPHRDLIPDRPACSQSLYRLSNGAHKDYVLKVLKELSILRCNFNFGFRCRSVLSIIAWLVENCRHMSLYNTKQLVLSMT
jgi:hypothetical protein